MSHQGVDDVARHPFLISEAVTDGVHQAGDAAKAVQPSTGQVGNMGDAAKRHQMMGADAMHRNAAHHHHVLPGVGKTVAQHFGRVELIAAKQALLPQLAHAARSTTGMAVVGGDAASLQQGVDRLLESSRIELATAGDADRCRGIAPDKFAAARRVCLLVIDRVHRLRR